MSTLELKAYEIFKNKLGEKEAETIIQFIEEKTHEKINEKKDVFLTKDDKVDLITRMETNKVELIKWIVALWIAQTIAMITLYLKH